MARIRTIKPEFFRHEELQDLEAENPGKYPMMVFAALWGHCDSKGRFRWKPRALKLDILPFLSFDMRDTLEILESAGLILRYVVDGEEYGVVPTFLKHQRLTGKEHSDGEKFPDVSLGEPVKHSGKIEEIPESQEGKGRERKGKENTSAKPPRFDPLSLDLPAGLSAETWAEWIAYRRTRKLTCAEPTIKGQLSNLSAWAQAGHSPGAVIRASIDNGWQGLFEPKGGGTNRPAQTSFDDIDYGEIRDL